MHGLDGLDGLTEFRAAQGGRDRSALAQQWRAATGDVEELQSMARDGRGSPFRVPMADMK